jgi:hypothetical protein
MIETVIFYSGKCCETNKIGKLIRSDWHCWSWYWVTLESHTGVSY